MVIGCLFVYWFEPVYILSILIVLGPPTIANFIWLEKSSRKKILLFSIVCLFLFAPPVELACRLADVWDVESIFSRPFGLIPLENMLFAFINIFWGLSFYDYFIDQSKLPSLSKKFKYLIGVFALFSTIIFFLYFINKNIIAMNYFTIAILVVVFPALLIYIKKPKLILKTILPTAFFAFVFFIYEIVSLLIGSWWWPGEYFYSFNLAGHVFPLDDIIIWYLFSTPALIAGYEFFADDFN